LIIHDVPPTEVDYLIIDTIAHYFLLPVVILLFLTFIADMFSPVLMFMFYSRLY